MAGIAAAYAFSHEGELDRDVIFDYAAQLEGHPDNVAPAVYGGMTVSWTQPGDGVVQPDGTTPAALFRSVNYLVGPDTTASVFIPDFELSTSKAREALPTVVPFADAVFNVSRAALLIGAMNPAMLTSPRDPNELLMEATEDKLHQAYRGPLMEPSARLITLLRANGFAAMVSGAGRACSCCTTATPTAQSTPWPTNSSNPGTGRCCTSPPTRRACRWRGCNQLRRV